MVLAVLNSVGMGGYSEVDACDRLVARFRKCRDLVREGKVLVKNKTKVASGVGYSDRGEVVF